MVGFDTTVVDTSYSLVRVLIYVRNAIELLLAVLSTFGTVIHTCTLQYIFVLALNSTLGYVVKHIRIRSL